MKRVAVRDLKARLSEYLALVKAGEEVVVTERGQTSREVRALTLVRNPARAPRGDGKAGSCPPGIRPAAR